MVREQEVVKIDEPWAKKRFSGKKFVFLVFILLSLSLLTYAFYDDFPSITGSVVGIIRGEDTSSNESQTFGIRAELNEINSYLDVNQEIGKISFELEKNDANIYLGKEGILNLSELDKARIEIEGFKGTIVFDKDKIYNLNGNAFKFNVNGISTSSFNSETKIAISKELNYDYLKLDSIYLKKYDSSMDKGKVVIDDGRVSLNLNDENFSVQGFFGKLESGLVGNFGIKKQGLILDGTASGVNVGGKFKIDVNS